MKKQVLLFVLMLMPLMASAQTNIDGIWYNLNSTDKVAEVTHDPSYTPMYIGDITIPNKVVKEGVTYSVTSIGYDAFRGCSDLTSITIPVSVTSIGGSAFDGCSNLTSVAIPNSVTSIGYYSFSGCTSLPVINNCRYADTYLVEVVDKSIATCSIKEGTRFIGDYAFSGCSSLTSVTIPNSVTTISSGAFSGCSSLTSVTIPNSVTSIGNYAFKNCYRLNTIYCLNPIPPTCVGYSTFSSDSNVRDKYDVYTYATLHVPMGSKEIYSSAYEWRYFNKIKEDMEVNGTVYYANLTVKQGTIGYTRQAIKAAETYTIYIGSLGDNKVNCVTFNGVDVTDNVVNGYYTTPEIIGESILSISFETGMDVKSLTLNSVKVKGYNGEISVDNIDEPSDVIVYSAEGKIVGNIPSAFGSVNLQVPSEQLYIVKVGSRTYKVAL